MDSQRRATQLRAPIQDLGLPLPRSAMAALWRCLMEIEMTENPSKADQIQKLREARLLAAQKRSANCVEEAKHNGDPVVLKSDPKVRS